MIVVIIQLNLYIKSVFFIVLRSKCKSNVNILEAGVEVLCSNYYLLYIAA